MYAIIETGGKQFRVEEGTKILVDRMAADVNSEVSLDKVLMVGGAEPVSYTHLTLPTICSV